LNTYSTSTRRNIGLEFCGKMSSAIKQTCEMVRQLKAQGKL
jgi:hypothetical protein